MKLADQLRSKTYKLTPLPKPSKPETVKQYHKRRFEGAKRNFIHKLDAQRREELGKKYCRPEYRHYTFLDVNVDYSDFKEIFDEYSTGQYKHDPLRYRLKQSGWFYDFLRWLQSENFQLESIVKHAAISWDDEDSYNFRVRW